MPAERLKAKANPALLAWARKSARLDVAAAAERATVKTSQIEAWEAGDDAPSIPQLRKLAEIYKRPLVIFYLSRPPKDFDALRDFRRLPAEAPAESPELASEIRWAHEMRDVALESYALLGVSIPKFAPKAKLDEAPATVADRLRATLGLDPARIFGLREIYEVYRVRRNAIEGAGVLCFQITGVEVAEARGFSINSGPLPVVAVNASDAVTARMFTLVHEVVHLALGATGTCDLHSRGNEDRDHIEVFCNAVAGEVLVPSATLKREPEVAHVRKPIDWNENTLRDLANRYKVSREVIARRFLDLGLATPKFYREKRDEYRIAEAAAADTAGGGNYYNNLRVKYGVPVIAGVLGAWGAGKLTANEAAAYLRVKVESLAKLNAMVS